ncbi:MAG: ATP--guanido phosphotransferase [Elusimicrobia bacterium]|nr:ATP--guanido phosphotransferase [Elusimicrobiota bacterium]
MNFNTLAKKDISWLSARNETPGIISTRIRLARNLKGVPFPGRAGTADLERCMDEIFNACEKIPYFRNSIKIKLNDCSDNQKRLFLERHLISHEHAVSSGSGGIIVDERETLSIMINEEDHMRLQYISGGLNLFESWDIIDTVDNELSRYLDYAYSDKLGYLTSCPTNTGTGMRASCQMHLAALGMINGVKSTMENVNRMGMVVRGLYGEGTKVMGNMLQISNQVTLGISEQHILDSLRRLVTKVRDRDDRVGRKILEDKYDVVKDIVSRAGGVLSNAHRISYGEALEMLSNLRFGAKMGIYGAQIGLLDNLMVRIQPAHIQEIYGRKMDHSEREIKRAEIIRQTIGTYINQGEKNV